ncbi:unnamed protein product [Hermetia illucens]|uniref:Uncharacterized protein n=1 Tax=Hermetia illucens TaxID=343691 RepID=A0A7R8URN7_HERIL|nr:uncharacterized protein LOC119653163 [Hermetia illucens]CAD7085764.1 unnamed protein product [Hermetia illucens]
MSGLEQWNRRDSAVCRLKEFLLRERPPNARESLNSSDGSDESFSLDLDESFQKVLSAHMKKRNNIVEDKENLYKTACENTLYATINQTVAEATTDRSETVYSFNDSTIIEDTSNDSDDCFEELERMCDKTFSDPDNTIHQYLAKKKLEKCSLNKENETVNISQPLKEANRQLNASKVDSGEQLNDIEEPSGLWDITIAGDISGIQFTPSKPTKFQPVITAIREESISKLSNQFSNLGGSMHGAEENSYKSRSASESGTDESQKSTIVFGGKEAEKDVDTTILINLSCPQLDDTLYDEKTTTTDCYITAHDTFPTSEVSRNNSKKVHHNVDSLITRDGEKSFANHAKDLLKDFSRTPKQKTSQQKFNVTHDLIDLDASLHVPIKEEENITDLFATKADDTIILLSDDEDHEAHNTAFSLDMEESQTDLSGMEYNEKQLTFNDTLEEVDYILKQGMKYMAENQEQLKPLKKERFPSPAPFSPQTPQTVIKKPKPFLSHEKPKNLEEFKRPLGTSRIPHCKAATVGKKPAFFKHIVSPVGAYINNTPQVPFKVDFKATTNVLQPKAARGLDYGAKDSSCKKKEQPSKECFSSLPKKAYISSEVKHVVDQRKPVTIPGGEKIHRYLQPIKVPAVIRHEGKIKSNIPSAHQRAPSINMVNNSLADLSTVAGDISLHVLKDAKRNLKH